MFYNRSTSLGARIRRFKSEDGFGLALYIRIQNKEGTQTGKISVPVETNFQFIK